MSEWFRSPPFRSWGAEGDPVRHMIMLQRCFSGREMRWSDALVTRTRRHAGGCLSGMEMALRLEMERLTPDASAILTGVPDACCWTHIQRDPTLIGATLLGHFRDRAAISLMQQDHHAGPAPEGEHQPFHADVEDALATINSSLAGWAEGRADADPMPIDLHAEAVPELVWSAAAILAGAMMSSGASRASDVLALLDEAGNAILARYDEEHAPYTQAALLAHRLRTKGIDEGHLLRLARHRHIVPLLAIMADRIGADMAATVRTVVDASEQMLFMLCRAAEFPREVAVRLVLGRRSVAQGVDDSMLVELADGYDLMALAEARDAMVDLRVTEPFRVKLALMHDRRTRHGY